MPPPRRDKYDQNPEEILPSDEANPDAKRKRKKVLLILGVVALGIIALIVGKVVGPVELQRQAEERRKQQEAAATSDQQRAKAFLDYWVTEIRLDNLDEAYRLTTTAYQARTSRQQFDRFVQENSDLKTPEPTWSFGLDGKRGNQFGFCLHRRKTNPYLLTVAKEKGEWKLDAIAVD